MIKKEALELFYFNGNRPMPEKTWNLSKDVKKRERRYRFDTGRCFSKVWSYTDIRRDDPGDHERVHDTLQGGSQRGR